MTPAVQTCIGERLPFWNRNVLFFSNIQSIFYGNLEETRELKRAITGLETYGGRLIPILGILFRGEGNRVILERKPDGILVDYFRHELGLQLPAVEILRHADYEPFTKTQSPSHLLFRKAEKWRQCSATWVDGFVTDDLLQRVSQRIGKKTITTQQGSFFGNNKLQLHQFLQQSGLPVFDTFLASNQKDVIQALDQLASKGYRSMAIKSQIGASGIGLVQVKKGGRLPTIPQHYFHFGPALVQGWLDPKSNSELHFSCSVQLFLTPRRVALYDLTEQILNRASVHEGNYAPPEQLKPGTRVRKEVLQQSELITLWLHRQGYRGTASIDFLVVQQGGNAQVYACEINARITGATYPSVLARHLTPNNAWFMRNLSFADQPTPKQLFAAIEKSDELFQSSSQQGIVPINLNIRKGRVLKGQFLFLYTSVEQCLQRLEKMRQTLGFHPHFDRD